MVIILRVICPQNQAFFFQNFRVGLHALEILDTAMLLGYTMIAHSVQNKTKVLHRCYDLKVKGQGH